MTTHLVTFSSPDMSQSAELCQRSAERHGVDRAHLCVPVEPSTERGYGFWKWKPAIIYNLLTNATGFIKLSDGDTLIYSDAGIEFINNVNHIIDRMDQDIFLFGNMWEHAHWCKRDIVEAVWPLIGHYNTAPANAFWSRFGKQVQASVIFSRVNDKTRAFVKEWLNWCLFEGGRLIDDTPSRTPNHPEFQENRHDQAILTTMAYRDGYRLHWWPAIYNDGAFTYEHGDYPDEGYPAIFHHHRRRNHEWKAGSMNAVASNASDERALSVRELSETVLKLKASGVRPLKAIKMSRATLLQLPLLPTQTSISTMYGVPVQIDDSLSLFESEPIYV